MTGDIVSPAIRVRCYVDGFNLYHGLREHSKCRRFRWLDVRALVTGLLLKDHALEHLTFFTSLPYWDTAKARRHQTYLDALKSTGVEVEEGRFQRDEMFCGASCGELFYRPVEKLTDVNIATTMLRDAVANRFDWAYIVSGDADQAPAVRALHEIAPGKKVHVIFPPRRPSTDLRSAADHATEPLGPRTLKAAQFPEIITLPGRTIRKPQKWVDEDGPSAASSGP